MWVPALQTGVADGQSVLLLQPHVSLATTQAGVVPLHVVVFVDEH